MQRIEFEPGTAGLQDPRISKHGHQGLVNE